MRYEVFEVADGFGYNILSDDGDVIIHQPHKPAVGGLKGFQTREEAEKIAKLVIKKLELGLNPAVSIQQVERAKTLDIDAEIMKEQSIMRSLRQENSSRENWR